MDRYKFGEFIYQKRKKKGLTQEEMGRMLGVTNKAISKWEVGETLPDITMLKPLADLLDVTVDELLSQKELKLEEKKVVKHNILLLVLVIVLGVLELFTIIGFVSYNAYQNNKKVEVILNQNNYSEILEIIPIDNFSLDGQNITINSLYKLDENYYLEDDLEFTIIYKINYYYYTSDGKLGVVTYYNRNVTVLLNSNTLEQSSSIILEPKTPIVNFESVKNVEISYEIISFEEIVYLKK